jgi:RND family efflux transporter MFP subunit
MNTPLRLTHRDDEETAVPPEAPPADGDLGFPLPEPARVSRTRALAVGAGIVSVLAAAFVLRWLPMRQAQAALAHEARTSEAVKPKVIVIAPTIVSSDRALALPGSVQPLEETVVYPRASGYVRKWHVDLGDKVHEGDLLAEIDTPELDQQLAQARAQLAQAEAGLVQAKANGHFSKENLDRYKQLGPEGLVSQQDLAKQKAQAEVDEAAIAVANANIGAQRANIQLLSQLKSFARVTAPFSGTITARNVERGALVTAGTATPLFKISATDPVRVFVQVPQDVAPSVRTDVPAAVKIREYPGRSFEGKVARSAGALDPTTRTMTTEVRVPNPKGELLTGMYAQVSLSLPTPHRVLSVPATAILSDAGGVHVVVIDNEGRARHVPVVVERDTGPTVEIASGLAPDDRVVKLPSAELTDGRPVDVAR